jgi:peptide/nickel transport system ATP-binding protein
MIEAAPDHSPSTARVLVQDLTVSVEGSNAAVVENVSLEVSAGEVLGLVGESGSGKTTLGLAMIGHVRRGLRISAGRVVFEGADVLSLPAARLRELRGAAMCYVPQDPSAALNPALKVGIQLREVLAAHGRSKAETEERVAEVLTEVGLADRSDLLQSYPHQLSGGQQQRVAIAMAFACRPKLIVMDEPTTGLDVTTQRTVLNTVAEMCSAYGVATVYVSHDVVVVGELSHRVAVLYAGEIVETGNTADVFAAPVHPYTEGLLRAVPSPERSQRLVRMEGLPPRPGHRPSGCSFAPRCPLRVEQCMAARPPLVPAGRGNRTARCILVQERLADHRAAFPAEPLPVQAITPSAQTAGLAVAGLDASYGSYQVLHDVSVAVSPNTCVAVVGESGSGKTTLARCVTGLHSDWHGQIAFNGEPLVAGVQDRAKESLRAIQYIFQNPYGSLNPRRTVGALIAQPLEHFAKSTARERDRLVFEAIASVSLPAEIADRYPDQLSGGERQRVAIARALVVSPEVLICDEVTSALDVSVQAAIIELLRRLQRERGLAMLFITHNLALVRSIAQHVVVMQSGRVVESGPVDQILNNAQNPYTQRLLEDVPKFWEAVERSTPGHVSEHA